MRQTFLLLRDKPIVRARDVKKPDELLTNSERTVAGEVLGAPLSNRAGRFSKDSGTVDGRVRQMSNPDRINRASLPELQHEIKTQWPYIFASKQSAREGASNYHRRSAEGAVYKLRLIGCGATPNNTLPQNVGRYVSRHTHYLSA